MTEIFDLSSINIPYAVLYEQNLSNIAHRIFSLLVAFLSIIYLQALSEILLRPNYSSKPTLKQSLCFVLLKNCNCDIVYTNYKYEE